MYKPTSQFIQLWIKRFGSRPDEFQLKKYLDNSFVIIKGKYWDGITINEILFIPELNLIFICDFQRKKIIKFIEPKKLKDLTYKENKEK